MSNSNISVGQRPAVRPRRGRTKRNGNTVQPVSERTTVSVSTAHAGAGLPGNNSKQPVYRRPNRAVSRNPNRGRSYLGAMELDYLRRSFRSPKEQSDHIQRVACIVAAYLDPEGHEAFVLPLGSGQISIYNSKQASELLGANDSATVPNLNAGDFGRFFIAYSPVLTDTQGYDASYPSTQLAIVDGGNRNTSWPVNLGTTTTNDRILYQRDVNADRYANSTLSGTGDKARVAGSSMLLTFDGDNYGGGGRLASKCMPGSSWPKRVTNTNPSGTSAKAAQNILQYETFSGQIPHSYQGKLRSGTYVWWCPTSFSDLEFRTIQAGTDATGATMSTWSAPYLACSGFINQNVGGTGTNIKNTLNVQCYTNFNYTTDDRTQPGMHIMDDEDAVTDALKILSMLPTAWPNELHQKIINTILGGIAGAVLSRSGVGLLLGALSGYGLNVQQVAKVVGPGK